MSILNKEPKELTIHEAYDILIKVQSSLIDKLSEEKCELESKGHHGLEIAAIENEINTLRKNLSPMKLFVASN